MPKLVFTHDDLLIIRWCVFDAKNSLPADKRTFLLIKIDQMLADDDEQLRMEKIMQQPKPAAAIYEEARARVRDW